MKRAVMLFLLLALVGLSAGASYRIQLRNGKVITADDKPVVKDDIAYFNRNGVYFYLPASQVDLVASERINVANVPNTFLADTPNAPATTAATPGAKPVFVGDEQLDTIRARSRLANEGELKTQAPAEGVAAPGKPSTSGAAGQPKVSSSGQRSDLQDQLNGILARQSGFQQQASSLQNQLTALQDSYNQSAQQADRERLQQQIDSVSSQLVDAQNNLSATQAEMQQVQQQLSSTPVVVETDVPPPKTND